jgi:hypothetical protein
VAYKQTSWLSRLIWLIAILLLGNIAMASYVLAQLFRVSTANFASELLTARRADVGWLGPALALTGMAVVIFAVRA